MKTKARKTSPLKIKSAVRCGGLAVSNHSRKIAAAR